MWHDNNSFSKFLYNYWNFEDLLLCDYNRFHRFFDDPFCDFQRLIDNIHIFLNLFQFFLNHSLFNINLKLLNICWCMFFRDNSLNLIIHLFHLLCQTRELMQFVHNLSESFVQGDYFRNNSIDCHKLLTSYWNLDNSLNFLNSWDLNNLINDLFDHVGNLHDLFDYFLNRDYFLNELLNFNDSVLIVWNLIFDYLHIFFNKEFFNDTISCLNFPRHFHLYFNNFFPHPINFL